MWINSPAAVLPVQGAEEQEEDVKVPENAWWQNTANSSIYLILADHHGNWKFSVLITRV